MSFVTALVARINYRIEECGVLSKSVTSLHSFCQTKQKVYRVMFPHKSQPNKNRTETT